jgi:hypothetical protein
MALSHVGARWGYSWEKAEVGWICLLSAALLAGAPAGGLGAAGEAADGVPYDLIVLVYAPEAGPAQVAMSYPKVVDHAAIEQGLVELARRTGARISGVRISNGRQGRGMAEVGTAAEFTATGLLDQLRGRPLGALPVGPMIRSLPEWRHLRLVFMVGEGFPWSGPGTTTADGFSVRLLSGMQPYEYDVERKSSRLAPREVARKRVGATRRAARTSGAVLPALLMGLLAGFAIGWLATGKRQRTRPGSGGL